jgi:hypothetical protein
MLPYGLKRGGTLSNSKIRGPRAAIKFYDYVLKLMETNLIKVTMSFQIF